MFDFKFDWSKEMECGIKVIDEQHMELFRIARDMEQLIVSQCKNVNNEHLLDIICKLREYAAYHFYTEEDLMRKNNYPKFMQHKTAHDNFTEQIVHINLPELSVNPVRVLSEIKEIVQEFLFHHILSEDYHLCEFLTACGY